MFLEKLYTELSVVHRALSSAASISERTVHCRVTDSPGETDPVTGVWSTDMSDCPGKHNKDNVGILIQSY